MSTATAARARGLTKTYGHGDTEVTALADVTLDLAPASFTAVMGPSGSGKSTLMHCLAGLDQPSSGQVFLGDLELGSLSDMQLTVLRRERVGFIFQSFNLLPTLSVAENIALPLLLSGRRPDQSWLDTVVGIVRLGDRLSHRPSELSGGQQQRVAVARALASQPEIVFADEPTGNLDSRSGAQLLGFLRQTVWPDSRLRCWSCVRISAPVFESRLPVGSSARITRGSTTSARAIATRCCSPPES